MHPALALTSSYLDRTRSARTQRAPAEAPLVAARLLRESRPPSEPSHTRPYWDPHTVIERHA